MSFTPTSLIDQLTLSQSDFKIYCYISQADKQNLKKKKLILTVSSSSDKNNPSFTAESSDPEQGVYFCM